MDLQTLLSIALSGWDCIGIVSDTHHLSEKTIALRHLGALLLTATGSFSGLATALHHPLLFTSFPLSACVLLSAS
jgi:hypothetical protein